MNLEGFSLLDTEACGLHLLSWAHRAKPTTRTGLTASGTACSRASRRANLCALGQHLCRHSCCFGLGAGKQAGGADALLPRLMTIQLSSPSPGRRSHSLLLSTELMTMDVLRACVRPRSSLSPNHPFLNYSSDRIIP